MARSSGFTRLVVAAAREDARRRRQAIANQKRYERAARQLAVKSERARKSQAKEDKQRYLDMRLEEVEDQNAELSNTIDALRSILSHTLDVNDTIAFDSLKISDPYTSQPVPQELLTARPAPDKQAFTAQIKPPGLLENALRLKGRYERELQVATSQYQAALTAYEQSETERQTRLAEWRQQDSAARNAYELKVEQRCREIDELAAAYTSGDTSAIITYNALVLDRSEYPDGFPQEFRLAYSPESKELVIEYDLPGVEVIPSVAEFRYVKSKDSIDEKPRKASEIKDLYQDIVAAVALRTVHEIYEADQGGHVSVVVFNGFVQSVDAATGKDIRPCLISVRATREQFFEINLARVDMRACLRNLGAQVSAQPQAMQPVKPIVEFNMVDKRFIEQGDVLGDLESRPNLMDLNPSQFETLVSNLFQKMGLETKLTRASRDGGVDAVAFDTRPVLGGKVVIQAKRYKNTVGVSAIRDLYGTMLNEGANKGIIVATSSYGPDAYDFAKDKPIELIDGGGLLYLLDQVGIKARIVLPIES